MHYKTKQKVTDFPIYPLSPHMHNSPPFDTLYLSAFTTVDEPALTHGVTPKSVVYVKTWSGCCTFLGFGQMWNDAYIS